MTDSTDLSDVQRRELLRVSKAQKHGGRRVAFVSRAHQSLTDAGLLTAISSLNPLAPVRLRCTSEGLRVAEQLRGEEAES